MVFFVSFSVLGPECILSDGDVKITCMAVVHHHDSVGGGRGNVSTPFQIK